MSFFQLSPLHAETVLGIGIGALEEGDERFRPAVIARWQSGNSFVQKLHFYGRDQGHIRQTTLLWTGSYGYPLFRSRWLKAYMGGAIAFDQSRIGTIGGEDPIRRHQAYNFGLNVGLGTFSTGSTVYSVDWNNAIFMAGTAGIYLATARKQSLNLGVGWRL